MAKYVSGLLFTFISLLVVTLHSVVTRKTYSERREALLRQKMPLSLMPFILIIFHLLNKNEFKSELRLNA